MTVGCNAYTIKNRDYTGRDLVRFDEVLTNFFIYQQSNFTCPYDGAYLFNVGFNAYLYDQPPVGHVGVYVNETDLIDVHAEGYLGEFWIFAHASGFVIVQCHHWQPVSIR